MWPDSKTYQHGVGLGFDDLVQDVRTAQVNTRPLLDRCDALLLANVERHMHDVLQVALQVDDRALDALELVHHVQLVVCQSKVYHFQSCSTMIPL
jgi:hypothetical protein